MSVGRYAESFTLKSSSLAGRDPSSIGFRQQLRDRFSSETPKIEFEASVEVPDILTCGKVFRFRTTFKVLEKSENVVLIPPITFRILKLRLLDFTVFRARRDWQADIWDWEGKATNDTDPSRVRVIPEEQEQDAVGKTFLNAKPEAMVVELGEVQNVGECWFTGRVPGPTVPSFNCGY